MAPADAPLGILAGGGAFPALAARAAADAGRRVVVAAIADEADLDRLEALRGGFDGRVEVVPILRGQLGRLFGTFRRAGVGEMVMIGGMRQRRMPRLAEIDLGGVLQVIRHWRLLTRGDDGVLRRLAKLIEAEGFRVVSIADVAPGLLVTAGALGRVAPSAANLADVATGVAAARALGRRDLGQGVVVAGGRVIAEEGRDGTDAMLTRLAGSAEAQGGVLVKAMKPEQDPRLDLPAIGPDTVARAAAAGLAGIAAEAGRAIVADRAAMIADADAAGLFVYGFPGEEG